MIAIDEREREKLIRTSSKPARNKIAVKVDRISNKVFEVVEFDVLSAEVKELYEKNMIERLYFENNCIFAITTNRDHIIAKDNFIKNLSE